MKKLASRSSHVLRTGVVLAALCACGVEERDHLRGELTAAKRENAELARRVETLSAEGSSARELLVEARRRADAGDAAKAELETQKAASEKQKETLEKVTSHRDEMKEWIETELLPVAEEKDPRLVNLRDAAKDMAAEVEKTRGLKFKRPFMRRLITREQVGEWMRRDMKKDMPEEDVRKLVTVGAAFGLMAPDTDIYAVFSGFLEAGAAAFYKPDTGTFYHIEGNDGRGARPIVFHELVHAVEDQYFALDEFYMAAEDDTDKQFARRGLVEGSACHFAKKYEAEHPDDVKEMQKAQQKPELAAKQFKMIQTCPPFLIAAMGLYPYNNAPDWLAKIGADDSAAIERLYKDPPVSTEQVLHPAKFPLDGPRDYPHLIATPDVAKVLGESYENVDDNNLGELMLGVLLAQLKQGGKYAPTFFSIMDNKTGGLGIKDAPKTASEGWDGDRYTAWREKATGAVTVVWVTVWDSEKDAQEFRDIYGELLGKRILGKDATRPEVVRYTDPANGHMSGLDLSGTKVVVVLNAPAERTAELLAAGAAASVTADPRDANDK
jgi:hypothetical protein